MLGLTVFWIGCLGFCSCVILGLGWLGCGLGFCGFGCLIGLIGGL